MILIKLFTALGNCCYFKLSSSVEEQFRYPRRGHIQNKKTSHISCTSGVQRTLIVKQDERLHIPFSMPEELSAPSLVVLLHHQ